MLSTLFLLFVLAAFVGALQAFRGTPTRGRLAAGLAGWLVLELLVALATWVFAGLDTWGNDTSGARHDLAWGGGVCAALLVVPLLQVRRYRRRG